MPPPWSSRVRCPGPVLAVGWRSNTMRTVDWVQLGILNSSWNRTYPYENKQKPTSFRKAKTHFSSRSRWVSILFVRIEITAIDTLLRSSLHDLNFCSCKSSSEFRAAIAYDVSDWDLWPRSSTTSTTSQIQRPVAFSDCRRLLSSGCHWSLT